MEERETRDGTEQRMQLPIKPQISQKLYGHLKLILSTH